MDPPNSLFTANELSRLIVYRAAVQAGFYSDWPLGIRTDALDHAAWTSAREPSIKIPLSALGSGAAPQHLHGELHP